MNQAGNTVLDVIERIRSGELSPDETHSVTGAFLVQMADGALALSILRKSLNGTSGCIAVERYDKGGFDGLLDSGWFDITEAEAELLDRISDGDA